MIVGGVVVAIVILAALVRCVSNASDEDSSAKVKKAKAVLTRKADFVINIEQPRINVGNLGGTARGNGIDNEDLTNNDSISDFVTNRVVEGADRSSVKG